MIKIAVIAFTEKGIELGRKIVSRAEGETFNFELFEKVDDLYQWTALMQREKRGLVFIGAMGIAVRAIASGLESKLSDAPVVVVDELGIHVIPVVGGHVGGANELALFLSDLIGATPVITTATDLESSFSVDLFAKENSLSIYNKDGIAKVSAKALKDKPIRICIENFPKEDGMAEVIVGRDARLKQACDILLCPKNYAVGIGCRKGMAFEELKAVFEVVLEENGIEVSDVGAIGSIDLKKDEEGLVELGRFYRIPFVTFTPELLSKAVGDFEESDFVKEKTGVGNVCERAAMLLTNNQGTLMQKKFAQNGITMAIARMD